MANFSIETNLPAINNTRQISCTMLGSGGTLVQLDNRPMSTSTPISQTSARSFSHSSKPTRHNTRTFNNQHTPVIKNPNRNKKVKDLIQDLRLQQQQQQQHHVQLSQDQIEQSLEQSSVHHQEFQNQQLQHSNQIYELSNSLHFNLQSLQDSQSSESMAIHNRLNSNNNYNQNYNQNYNLINDGNDEYLVNNSKLITLNRLNNESESVMSHSNNNQMDLLTNINHQNFNYMLQEATNGMNGNGSCTNINSINLDTSIRSNLNTYLNQQQYNNQNHLNTVDGTAVDSVHSSFSLSAQYQQQSNHNQQQFDDYNQDQICLDEADVNEAENTNEEYLIFSLLNKIATCTNTDKLISSISDDENTDKTNRQPLKRSNEKEEQTPSYITLTSIVTSNNKAINQNNITSSNSAIVNTNVSTNSTASSSCSPSSSESPPVSSPPSTTTLFQLSHLKKEKLDDFLPSLSHIIKPFESSPVVINQSIITKPLDQHNTTSTTVDTESPQTGGSSSSSSSSCCSSSSSSSLNSNMMLMMMNNHCYKNKNSSDPNLIQTSINNETSCIDINQHFSEFAHQQSQQQQQFEQYHHSIREQNSLQTHQHQQLLQPTQECRVEILSPTNAQMEEINTKDLAHRVSSELKRYSIPQAIFAQRVLCRSQGTLSDLLRNPKPWSKLKSGRETFRRMYKWLQEPESQRMNSLRIAAASKRKEDDDDCLDNSVNTEKTGEYCLGGMDEENQSPDAEKEEEEEELADETEEEEEETESENENSNDTKNIQIWKNNNSCHNDSFSNYEMFNQRIDSQHHQLLPSASTLLSLSNESQPNFGTDLHQFDASNLTSISQNTLQNIHLDNQSQGSLNDYNLCSGQPPSKKPRLVFTDIQRRTLQAIFKETKRPSKEMQVTIAQQLGLEVTTVSNFFMNARRRSMDKWKDQCDDDDNSNCSSLTR